MIFLLLTSTTICVTFFLYKFMAYELLILPKEEGSHFQIREDRY